MENRKSFYFEDLSRNTKRRHSYHGDYEKLRQNLYLDSSAERKVKEKYDTYKRELIEKHKRELLTGKSKLSRISNGNYLHPLESVAEEHEMSRTQSSAATVSRGVSPDRKHIPPVTTTKLAASQFKRLLSRKSKTEKIEKRHSFPKLYHSHHYWERDCRKREISFKKIARTVLLSLRWYRLHNFRYD